MITVKLNGGLGNQLFQYATGRALSLQHGVSLLLDLSNYEYYDVHPLRIQYFCQEVNTVSHSGRLYKFLNSIRVQRFLKRCGLRKHVYIEDYIGFDSRLLNSNKNAVLYGYFQSEKYFESIRSLLLNELNVKADFLAPVSCVESSIKSCSISVSIHVRRGDYISNESANAVHGVCGLGYFTEALKWIVNDIDTEDIDVFVFSDDIEWCKENLSLEYRTHYVEGHSDEPELDLHLMSICDHNVISNSTFSWWAAWLNQHKNKVVVAPKQWFKNTDLSSKDLVPDSWIRI